MKAAYVGILTPGTTSRMRADVLQALTPGWQWTRIDTHPPYLQAPRWAQTLSFRLKAGPVISRTNALVQRELAAPHDLVWVDKAANLSLATTQRLRSQAGTLVHFTPDTAFHTNKSKAFNRSLALYDWAITTKTFEKEAYAPWIAADKLIFTTQGYDPELHFPRFTPAEKQPEAVFIGLAEPDRLACMEALIQAGVRVRVGGMGWEAFARQYAGKEHFAYLGPKVFGEDYSQALSRAWIGLGLLSKRFPELHTTRTFEIPACGSVLATPDNAETRSQFAAEEALFFQDYDDLAAQLPPLLTDAKRLAAMAEAGRKRVAADGRDYPTLLRNLLKQTGCPPENV